MSGNALLERTSSPGFHDSASYHADMAAPPQWPPYAPAKPARRWLPAAIIGAAVLIAAAVVAAAIIISGNKSETASSGNTSANTPVASSSTCKAWVVARAAFYAVPQLPQGWDWDTPNIDTYINNRATAVTRALDVFEPKIAATPADVSAAAHKYVEMRRQELQELKDHTYGQTTLVDGVMADQTLDQLCGIKDAP